jgi:hypothetical protein
VDTLGLLLAVTVTTAAADDGTAAPEVLEKLKREEFPRLQKLWWCLTMAKEQAGNNFPISRGLGDGPVVPFG